MPMLLPTIAELVVTQFKRCGYFMVFNRGYNDVHAFKRDMHEVHYLDKAETDQAARAEFMQFMQDHFPDVTLYPVLDMVPLGYLSWPYLGTLAFDIEPDSPVYNALVDKYDNPEGKARCNHAVFWAIDYEVAKAHHEARLAQLARLAECDDDADTSSESPDA